MPEREQELARAKNPIVVDNPRRQLTSPGADDLGQWNGAWRGVAVGDFDFGHWMRLLRLQGVLAHFPRKEAVFICVWLIDAVQHVAVVQFRHPFYSLAPTCWLGAS
jgi:hypothetical protein